MFPPQFFFQLRSSCFQLFWSSRLEQPTGISQRLITVSWCCSQRCLKTFLFAR